MDKEILELLRAIQSDVADIKQQQSKTNERLNRIEKKIDSVYDQTADLTEFRTETKQGIENIQKDINRLTNVTKTNCFDIADLKAVK